MAPCISKLPSVCLEAIFKHVPLVDLFYFVGLVCTSWYKSCRSELKRRRRLRLIQSDDCEQETLNYYRVHECSYGTKLIEHVRRDDGSPWHTIESLEQYKFNYLPVPNGMKNIPFFSSLVNMSNITRLHLILDCTTSDLAQVIRLIENLSEHLVELKIKIYFYPDRYTEKSDDDDEDNDSATREHVLNAPNLIDCLNSLQSVRHLNLDLSNLGSSPPLLSCLSRLTTFAIRLHDNSKDWIFDSIKQYAQNVTSIEMYNSVDIRAMLQFDAQLASKFTDLSVSYDDLNEDGDEDSMQVISLFCARFSFLTKLYLYPILPPLPMTKLAQCLSSLTQLVYLDLHCIDTPSVEGEQSEEELEKEEGDGEVQQKEEKIGEIEDQAQFTQVLSVRLLTIHLLYTKSHHDSERLFVPEIFPNIQVFRFDHTFSECSHCEISRVDVYDPELARRFAECKRLVRQPFRRCTNLHTVALIVSGKETLINLDEL